MEQRFKLTVFRTPPTQIEEKLSQDDTKVVDKGLTEHVQEEGGQGEGEEEGMMMAVADEAGSQKAEEPPQGMPMDIDEEINPPQEKIIEAAGDISKPIPTQVEPPVSTPMEQKPNEQIEVVAGIEGNKVQSRQPWDEVSTGRGHIGIFCYMASS